jgi:hypothetical protein
VFEGTVQGVVVQPRRKVFSRPRTLNFVVMLGSSTSRYPSPTSPALSAVPPSGHHHTTLRPRYSSPRSKSVLSAHQTLCT